MSEQDHQKTEEDQQFLNLKGDFYECNRQLSSGILRCRQRI